MNSASARGDPTRDEKPAVLVTGSSGFIGSAVVKRLAARYRIFGLDQPGGADPPPPAEDIDVDLTKEESVKTALDDVRRRLSGASGDPPRLASVIHLAAYYDFSGEPSPLYEQVTVRGTERLLRLLKTAQPEQFVFSSTMLVHSPCEPGEHINEDSPIDPKWDYPQSKVRTEQLILAERG